jgi:hypothetical protein
MAHYREQIRKAAVTAVTGLTTTAARVKSGPAYNLADNMSPTLVVWARTSTPDYERGQLASSPLWAVELIVEGYVKTHDTLLDTLDDIASEVETAIYTDAALIALCNGFIELGEQTIEFDTDGDMPLGKIEMIFNVFYHALEGAPDSKV